MSTLQRSEITSEHKVQILLTEMDVIQRVFDKHDNWMLAVRAGVITALGGFMWREFTKEQEVTAWIGVTIVLLGFLLEGLIRWEHWYAYVKRHKVISNFLNDPASPGIFLYDPKNKRIETSELSLHKFQKCFAKVDTLFFFVGGLVTFVWWPFIAGIASSRYQEGNVTSHILQSVSVVAAIVAAAFWLWSATMFIPDMAETQISGPKSATGYMKRQSRLSAIAAAFAGVSAIASATSVYLTQ